MERVYNNMMGVSVRFETSAVATYTYCAPNTTEVEAGDYVVVLTPRGGFKTVEVVAVNVPLDATRTWERIVSVVEFTAYEEWTQMRNEVRDLHTGIEARVEHLRSTITAEELRMRDATLNDMLTTLESYVGRDGADEYRAAVTAPEEATTVSDEANALSDEMIRAIEIAYTAPAVPASPAPFPWADLAAGVTTGAGTTATTGTRTSDSLFR